MQIVFGVQGNHIFLRIIKIEPNLPLLYILVYSPNYFNYAQQVSFRNLKLRLKGEDSSQIVVVGSGSVHLTSLS